MNRVVSLVVLSTFLSTVGCYNTYYVPRGELVKVQTRPEDGRADVQDVKGNSIEVKDETRLFVRSQGGKRYPITPFNFQMTESQVVASDRDYILSLEGLEENAEVDHMSTWKTAILISGGVVIVGTIVGLIAWASVSSGGSSGN